jgi:hypothetical protein
MCACSISLAVVSSSIYGHINSDWALVEKTILLAPHNLFTRQKPYKEIQYILVTREITR